MSVVSICALESNGFEQSHGLNLCAERSPPFFRNPRIVATMFFSWDSANRVTDMASFFPSFSVL